MSEQLAPESTASEAPTATRPGAGALLGDAAAAMRAQTEVTPLAHAGALDTGRARFRTNILANVAYFVLSVGIGIWYTPYLIRNLGIATYGLVPLATSVTSYMSLLTVALSGAVGRFLTLDLARGDIESANRTFNTAFWGSVAVAGALIVPALGLAVGLPLLLDIPRGSEGAVRVLLLGTVGAFLVATVGSAFSVSTFVCKRFDIANAISGVRLIAQTALVVLFFAWLAPRVWHVGVAILSAALVSAVGAIWAWKRLMPWLRVRVSSFDRARLSALLGMGGWLVVDRVGSILFLSVDLLVANMVVGAVAAGRYAPLLQWSFLLRTAAGLVAGVLPATIVTLHAWGDTERLVRLSRQAVKLLGLAMALPIGLVCGLSRPLLETWLGPDFSGLAPLMWLLIAPLCINLAVVPLFSISFAVNKVRWPGLVTGAMGLVNAGLAVALAGPAGWGLYGIAAAGAIMLTAKNAAFTPIYAALVLRRPAHSFLSAMVPGVLATAAVATAAFAGSLVWDLRSWPHLMLAAAAMTATYVPLVFTVGLSRQDRSEVLRLALEQRGTGL